VGYYRNFRSYRWVGDRLAVRLQQRLTVAAVAELNAAFRDILDGGQIVQMGALPEERNEPEIADLPRLVLTPLRRRFGRLRQFFDAVNLAATEA